MIRVTRVRVWLVVRSLLVYILINLILIVIRSEMHYMKKWFEMNFERIHGRNNKTWQKNRLPFFFESWIKETEPRKKEISKYKNTEISRRVFHIIIKRDLSSSPEEITKARKAFIQSPGNSIPWRINFTAGFVQVFKILVKSNRDSMFGFDIKKRTVGIDCPRVVHVSRLINRSRNHAIQSSSNRSSTTLFSLFPFEIRWTRGER